MGEYLRRGCWAFLAYVVLTVPVYSQSATDYFKQAFKISAEGNKLGALELYMEGLRLDESNGLGHYYTAKILDDLYRKDEAYQHYRRASELIPGSEEGMNALASRRILAREVFAHYAEYYEFRKRFFNYRVAFASRTHKFCAWMSRYSIPHDGETFALSQEAFVEWRLATWSRKTRQLKTYTQRYSLAWGSVDTSSVEFKMDAAGDLSVAGKYMPEIVLKFQRYGSDEPYVNIENISNGIFETKEIEWQETRASSESCWSR